MSAEIVLRLPYSDTHQELLWRKIEYYWKKAEIHTAKASRTNEPATVIPGPELDLIDL